MLDPISLLMATPYAWIIPYLLAFSGCCAIITAAIPAPKGKVGASIWSVLNFFAVNLGHAKNAAAPGSAVPSVITKAGPTAILLLAALGLSSCASTPTTITPQQVAAALHLAGGLAIAGADAYAAEPTTNAADKAKVALAASEVTGALAAMDAAIAGGTSPNPFKLAQTALAALSATLPPGKISPQATTAIDVASAVLSAYVALQPAS